MVLEWENIENERTPFSALSSRVNNAGMWNSK